MSPSLSHRWHSELDAQIFAATSSFPLQSRAQCSGDSLDASADDIGAACHDQPTGCDEASKDNSATKDTAGRCPKDEDACDADESARRAMPSRRNVNRHKRHAAMSRSVVDASQLSSESVSARSDRDRKQRATGVREMQPSSAAADAIDVEAVRRAIHILACVHHQGGQLCALRARDVRQHLINVGLLTPAQASGAKSELLALMRDVFARVNASDVAKDPLQLDESSRS